MDKYAPRLFSGPSEGGKAATKQNTGDKGVIQNEMNRVSKGRGRVPRDPLVTASLVKVGVGVNYAEVYRGFFFGVAVCEGGCYTLQWILKHISASAFWQASYVLLLCHVVAHLSCLCLVIKSDADNFLLIV